MTVSVRRALSAVSIVRLAVVLFAEEPAPTQVEKPVLRLRAAEKPPIVDGKGETLWDGTEALTLRFAAEGQPRKVVLKSLLAGNAVFFLARWESLSDAPTPFVWEKQADRGWKALPEKAVVVRDYRGTRSLEWSRPAKGFSVPADARKTSLDIFVADATKTREAFRIESLEWEFRGSPLKPSAEALERGKTAHEALCARCHPMEGESIYPNAEPFKGLNERADDLVLWEFIRNGFADVSAYREERLQELFAYLRSLG